MRSTLSILMLICLVSAVHFQPSHSSNTRTSGFKLKNLFDGHHGKHFGGTDVISSRKFGLGIKAVLLKPLLLVALAKIKLALLFGKPLVLLTLKKLLLDVVLGKLLLKIPLILLGGKALIAKVLALKFALIAKGLIGLKAPLVLLFLGGFLKGALKGTGLGLAIAGGLLKLNDHGSSAEDEYDEHYYALPPPPPPSYGAPSYYSAPASYSSAPAPVYSSPDPLYSQNYDAAISEYSGVGGGYDIGRKKRNAERRNDEDDSEEEVEDSEEDLTDESPEDLKLEFEAARTNANAYLYMAAQFDEQSCGRRLMCEVYQKPQGSRTDDELILQDIFGYPLAPLSEEDQGTPKEMYYRAAQLGASNQGRPNQICARVYATCPHNAEQLIHFFVSEDVETNEIDSDNRPVSHLQPPKQSATRLPFYHPRQPNISPAQQWKPALVRPAVHKQQPQTTKPTQEQVRRPTVAVTPVAPLRKRFIAAPAA